MQEPPPTKTRLRPRQALRAAISWLIPRVLLALALLYLFFEAKFVPIRAVYEGY